MVRKKSELPAASSASRRLPKKLGTLLDLCVSSLRRGHANLLCIVPIVSDDPRRQSGIVRKNQNFLLLLLLREDFQKNLVHFSICACHPCAGAMLIFSVSFQFYRMIPEGNPVWCEKNQNFLLLLLLREDFQKKTWYTSRFVRVILAQGRRESGMVPRKHDSRLPRQQWCWDL